MRPIGRRAAARQQAAAASSGFGKLLDAADFVPQLRGAFVALFVDGGLQLLAQPDQVRLLIGALAAVPRPATGVYGLAVDDLNDT